jgi:hypothetical protein
MGEGDAKAFDVPAGSVTPHVVFPQNTTVLFIDFMKDRSFKFRCTGRRILYTKYATEWDEACNEITLRCWDAIFLPGHIPLNRDRDHLVELILKKHYKPLLVVHHGLDQSFVAHQKQLLNKGGVRMAAVPWNYDDPSVHRRVKL